MHQVVNHLPTSGEDSVEFSVQLSPRNFWVCMAKLIPWIEIDKKFSAVIDSKYGRFDYPLRMILGSLIIWDYYNLPDAETVEHIKESPYLQFFIGLHEYRDDLPLDSKVMSEFRKRINAEMLNEINNMILVFISSREGKNIH